MARRYTSFVVRCWRLEAAARRIEIEHVQSGARTRVASVADALAWMEARAGRPAGGAAPSAQEHDGRTAGTQRRTGRKGHV